MAPQKFERIRKLLQRRFFLREGTKESHDKKQDREIVKLATAVKPLTTQQIAHKLTAKGK